jgi:hypothetical protein
MIRMMATTTSNSIREKPRGTEVPDSLARFSFSVNMVVTFFL